ncbi:MAG: DNA double-strand break repair nuclease NurA [Anaerolineae bacterium]|nr:DNA double-strand break repair nuclease NurA [Anaerolineae bacterium]
MPLDFAVIQPHIARMAAQAHTQSLADRLREACELLRSVDTDHLRQVLREREQSDRIPWLVARPREEVGAAYPPPLPCSDFSVVASDGSVIPPDRHSPLRFFVLNTGLARLTYGQRPDAHLWARSLFCAGEEDLYINAAGRRIPVEDARLGLRMALEELRALFEAAQEAPANGPVLALRDGSLIFWALQNEEEAVVRHFLPPILDSLERFQKAGIPIVSYISYPGAQDVANSLRLLVCGKDPPHCGQCAEASTEERALCRALADFRDQALFLRHLQPGQRSALFDSTSAILDRYGEQRVQFFYLHTGEEIARLEVPQWAMQDETLRGFLHAAVADQCRRGRGYPQALIEAHEEAVIPSTEHRLVEQLVEEALAAQGVVYVRSAKDRSKRERGI